MILVMLPFYQLIKKRILYNTTNNENQKSGIIEQIDDMNLEDSEP